MPNLARLLTTWSAKTVNIDPDTGQIYDANGLLLTGNAPIAVAIAAAQLLAMKASPVVILSALRSHNAMKRYFILVLKEFGR